MNKHIILVHTGFYDHNKKGFTLLEILLAIFIFSILVTSVFGSFNFILKNVNGLKDIMEIHDMGSRCIQRMVLDLESIHVTPQTIYETHKSRDISDPHPVKGGPRISGSYSNPALMFSSHAHLPFYGHGGTGVAEIVYYMEKTTYNDGRLKRSDRLFSDTAFEPSKTDPVVCDSVASLTFSFFDCEGNKSDYWDSNSGEFSFSTPSAIGIYLEIEGKSGIYPFKTLVSLPVVRNKIEK